jgi:glycosyltransferase involved in cell wall biosynthesis
VAFLGRLDPVKRPWLVAELAQRRPDVRFELMGERWVRGWESRALPENVVPLGHIDGEAKAAHLSRAWLLINTSIHEGLPVSFCEALRVGLPLLATVDPEAVTSRFGYFTGVAPGDGMTLLPELERGLDLLLSDHSLRRQLGNDGMNWATEHHSVAAFLRALVAIYSAIGVNRAARAVSSVLEEV